MAERAHPTSAQYWLIALLLAVITAAEVLVPQFSIFDGSPRVVLLYVMGGVKFVIVVAFFMHLRFDKPLYRNLFLIGAIGALPMFFVLLLLFAAI